MIPTHTFTLLRAMQTQLQTMEAQQRLLRQQLTEIQQILTCHHVVGYDPIRYEISHSQPKNSLVSQPLEGKEITRPAVRKGESALCVRCGHEWVTRTDNPQKCPTCHSPWWYQPKWRWAKKAELPLNMQIETGMAGITYDKAEEDVP